MQDVAERVDQSCRRCAFRAAIRDDRAKPCVYAKWGAPYIWLEVETALAELAKSTDIAWNINAQRRILNLMWHYRQAAE